MHTHVHICTCVHICNLKYMYICLYIYTHIHMCVCVFETDFYWFLSQGLLCNTIAKLLVLYIHIRK